MSRCYDCGERDPYCECSVKQRDREKLQDMLRDTIREQFEAVGLSENAQATEIAHLKNRLENSFPIVDRGLVDVYCSCGAIALAPIANWMADIESQGWTDPENNGEDGCTATCYRCTKLEGVPIHIPAPTFPSPLLYTCPLCRRAVARNEWEAENGMCTTCF